MPESEAEIQNAVRLALSRAGARVFRNSVGRFRTPDGRLYTTGLCPSSSDLIGWYHGLFVACEIKTPTGRATAGQLNFIDRVNADGGIGFIATSADEALTQLNQLYSERSHPLCNPTTPHHSPN